jgi:enoyl-CoA hydratase
VRHERPSEGVHLLVLDDPQRRNALGAELLAGLTNAIEALAADPGVRAVVITGEGSAFCAGADLGAMFGQERPVAELRADLREYYAGFLRILDLPMPVIAAVNGPAIGAGLNLAMVCDMRFGGPAAKLGATFSRIGLHPGGGCTYFLTRELGPGRALRLLLAGRTLDSQAALAAGLLDELHTDPLAAALQAAQEIAAMDPSLARDIKRAVEIASTGDLQATVEFEAWAQAASAARPAIREWAARFTR